MSENNTPDTFDRRMWAIHDLPDVLHTRPSTLQITGTESVKADTYIVQTYRQAERGDTIFLQHISGDHATRIVIPAKVADAIARQRQQLTDTARSKAAKKTAQDRKERGEQPAFLKKVQAGS